MAKKTHERYLKCKKFKNKSACKFLLQQNFAFVAFVIFDVFCALSARPAQIFGMFCRCEKMKQPVK